MSIDEVVDQILTLGRGTELAKIDIESAFRNIPVHPHDRHLLGMSWNNQLFMDTVLPFGLRSGRCTSVDCTQQGSGIHM